MEVDYRAALGEQLLKDAALTYVKPLLYIPGKGFTDDIKRDYVLPAEAKGSTNNYPVQQSNGKFKSLNNVRSVLGTPVFSNLEIRDGSYKIGNRKGSYTGFNTKHKNPLNTVLFDISMTKNIVKTPLQGVNGTVKEYISDGDFAVNIKGYLVGQGLSYPEQELNALIKIIKAPIALKMDSWLLKAFGIYELVIEDYSIPATEYMNLQYFELKCLSDLPIELVYDSNN